MQLCDPTSCSFLPDVALESCDVHTPRAKFDRADALHINSDNLLTTDEKDRASRFRSDRDKNRLTASRAIARTIPSSYPEVNPDWLQFSYGQYANRELKNQNRDGTALRFRPLCFQSLSLVAVTIAGRRGKSRQAVAWSLYELESRHRLFGVVAVKGCCRLRLHGNSNRKTRSRRLP
jgi:hypothetical protein